MLNRPRISLKVLKGEKTDGSGRISIHLFVRDDKGLFVEPHVLHKAPPDKDGTEHKRRLVTKPTRGRLACDPRKDPKPVKRNGIIHVTMRSDDPRAVTCPKCMSSPEYKELMNRLEESHKVNESIEE